MKIIFKALVILIMMVILAQPGQAAEINLNFLFPVETAGPLAIEMENIVEEFNEENQNIHVNPIFTGDYDATEERIYTSVSAENPPNIALTQMVSARDYKIMDAVHDLSEYIEEEGLYDEFVSGFWRNFEIEDGIWGLPFQHSTPLLYFNLDILEEAGLERRPPETWEELREYGEKINENLPDVTPFVFPTDQWIAQTFVNSNSGEFVKDFDEPNFNDDKTIESIEFLYDLIYNYEIAEPRNYGPASEDFLAEDAAIMVNSTGSLGYVRDYAVFDWNTGAIPKNVEELSLPYGGGGLYLFKGHSEEETEAAWEFMKYLTSPEVTAQWSEVTGYFAVRDEAYDLPKMVELLEEFPQMENAVEQLEYTQAQWVTENYAQVSSLVDDYMEEVLVVDQTAPGEAMHEMQKEALEIID